MWCVSSWSDSVRLLVRQAENSTSWQRSFRERYTVGSRFSEALFLDILGIATEQVRICGFWRKPSSSDKAPKMRDSVQLNSWESFLVTLPSISSETWVMYSSAILGWIVFCDWLLLVSSGVSLETGVNFLLFLNVAVFLRKSLSVVKTELIFFKQIVDLFFHEGEGFNIGKQLTMENLSTTPERRQFMQ